VRRRRHARRACGGLFTARGIVRGCRRRRSILKMPLVALPLGEEKLAESPEGTAGMALYEPGVCMAFLGAGLGLGLGYRPQNAPHLNRRLKTQALAVQKRGPVRWKEAPLIAARRAVWRRLSFRFCLGEKAMRFVLCPCRS
jgi:hypothetical protein